MKAMFYNKSLPIEKYFGTNLSITELSIIHDKFEFIVCTHSEFSYLKLPAFKYITIENIDDLFNIDNENILVIRSIMKKYNGYQVKYLEINKKLIIEMIPEILDDKHYLSSLRKDKIRNILELEKLKALWIEKNS